MNNDPTGASVRARIPYESIVRRRALRLPGDARVAVWTIVNVENWSPAGPMPRAILTRSSTALRRCSLVEPKSTMTPPFLICRGLAPANRCTSRRIIAGVTPGRVAVVGMVVLAISFSISQ